MSLQPALFIGHGSPMNAVADNSYTQTLRKFSQSLPRPKAALVISAHWMTEGTWVTAMERPKTIHDFYGFPQVLFDIQYPAPGSPTIANLISQTVTSVRVNHDKEMWGLDHGTWSVLRHLWPNADVPVLQLSLDLQQPPEFHFKLGQELTKLREAGVMLIASGNLVHNLRRIRWEENAEPYTWAVEYNNWLKDKITRRDSSALYGDFLTTEAGKLSVPTLEHYLPLLYIMGAGKSTDKLEIIFDELQNGSISMLSFGFLDQPHA